MKYRRMGRTGIKVSELCLGTMTFGRTVSSVEATRMVDMSLDAGVNFFDTANSYSNGESERQLGNAIQGKRNRAVIATKVFNPMGTGINDSGMSRYHIISALEESLRRLKTDHVDVYYIHHVDEQTELEEMLRAMDSLVQQGKVLYIGCSNYEAWRLSESLGISERSGLSRFECYQPQYSLAVRDIELELLPLCDYKRLGVAVWSPLAGGFLTGKYSSSEKIKTGTRSEEEWAYPVQYFSSKVDLIISTLVDIAKRIDKKPAQVALRWVMERPGITSAIVGARNVDQLLDNLDSTGWKLDSELSKTLTKISQPDPRYPQSMEKGMVARRAEAVKK